MRKKLKYLLLYSIFCSNINAQDIIIRLDGNEIKSKIIEIKHDFIKYEEFESHDKSIKRIQISEVFMVIYENGEREKFTTIDNSIHSELINKKLKEEGDYVSLAGGLGNSYGGLGLRIQYVNSSNFRTGVHGGIGFIPGMGMILFSCGIQYYFWEYAYLDMQFGAFGGYERTSHTPYGTYYESERIWGPSLLLGFDWYLNKNFGLNFATGVSTKEFYFEEFTIAFDLGLIVRF